MVKYILKIIGISIWVLGGGMLLAVFFTGFPLIFIVLAGEKIIYWLKDYIPQIFIVISIATFLIWGITEKRNSID